MAKAKTAAAVNRAMADFEEKFEKTYGAGTLLSGDSEKPYDVIPTGSIDLDLAMGVGGYVRGRLTEIWGQDDIGKTTLAMQGIREAQIAVPDRIPFFVDMENKWDWNWARSHGVETGKRAFKLYVPESAEDVADAVKDAVRSGLFSFVVVDSIGAMIPEIEKEKDADEATVAAQARIVTRMVKIAAVEARKTSTSVVMLNQVRANITASPKAKQTTTTGGFALKHCSTHKIEMRRGPQGALFDNLAGGKREVGHEVACYIERNKVALPKKTAYFTLLHTPSKYGPPGLDRVDEATTVAINTGVIAQKGGWYTNTITGERVNGREAVVEMLRTDPSMVGQVRERALAILSGDIVDPEMADAEIDKEIEQAPDDDAPVLEGTGLFKGNE